MYQISTSVVNKKLQKQSGACMYAIAVNEQHRYIRVKLLWKKLSGCRVYCEFIERHVKNIPDKRIPWSSKKMKFERATLRKSRSK